MIEVWCDPHNQNDGHRCEVVIEAFGCSRVFKRRGKLVWATADESAKNAIDYREYEWPDVFTLCFGPDYKSAEHMIRSCDDRITIPGLPHALYSDQAMAIILGYLNSLHD